MNRANFFASIRQRNSGVFGTALTQAKVSGINHILDAAAGRPVSHVAYILATAYHETGATMQPVREAFGKSDGDSINRLERAWKAGRMPQVRTPYWRADANGKSWFGRGYVQLTHRDNYAKAAALTGVDLLSQPDRAMEPKVAAKILVEGSEAGMFTGKRLSHYLPGDYIGARRIINGTDKAKLIAGYAAAFERALQAAGYSVTAKTPAKPQTPPTPRKTAPTGKQVAVGGGIAAILAALAAKWQAVEAWFNNLFGG